MMMKKSLILLTVVIWAVTEPVENDCSKKTTSEETNDHWSYNIQDPETLHVKVFLLTVDLRKTNLKLVFLLDYELRILEAGKIIAFKDGRDDVIVIDVNNLITYHLIKCYYIIVLILFPDCMGDILHNSLLHTNKLFSETCSHLDLAGPLSEGHHN